MMLITIDEHPLRSDVFDKFLAGMAIEAECRAAIRRADCAYRLSPPACAEYGIPCGHCTECQPGGAAWPAVTPDHSQDRSYDGPTTMDRLQALHDRMDALNAHFAELRQAGRLKEPTTPVSDQALWLWLNRLRRLSGYTRTDKPALDRRFYRRESLLG